MRLGLRSQILIGLVFALSTAFALLDATVIRLSRTRQFHERRLIAEDLAQTLPLHLLSRLSDEVLAQELQKWLARTHFASGIELEQDGRLLVRVGNTRRGEATRVVLDNALQVRVFTKHVEVNIHGPLQQLLLLYTVLAGLTILAFTYLVLTFWIVAPVERLTRASESLAKGRLDVRVPEQGSAEVERLARAFNRMAEELKQEKSNLEARLRELEETAGRLRHTQGQLIHSEKLASVGKLAAGVAHEIGNPLSAILGMVELMQSAPLPEERRGEFLRRIARETQRIHKTIRDLLDFARSGSRGEAKREIVDMAKLVEETITLLTPQKDTRAITLERRYHEEQLYVAVPSAELTQVVLNLLLNAVDAIEGQGSITVELKVVEGEKVSLTVTDSGPGIAPEVLDHLFEPFVTTKPPGKGTGLGLSVCHGIVESLGGTIMARNLAQGGAQFELQLPRVSA